MSDAIPNFDVLPPGDSVSQMAGGVADLKKGRRRKRTVNGEARTDRLPPHSLEAERGVLGCVLLTPRIALAECVSALKTNVEVFYDLRHQTIYKAMLEMDARQMEIDLITLMQWLEDEQQLEGIGGIQYLNELQDAVPSAANFSYYAGIVKEKFLMRSAIHVCTDLIGSVYEWTGEVDELLDRSESEFLGIRERFMSTKSQGMLEVMHGSMAKVEMLSNRNGELTGIATGFQDLDAMTCGLQAGEMIVIAARPSMGKTSLAMNIAEHAAIVNRLPVGVFSLEMTSEALGMRLLSSQARVNMRNVREGYIAEADYPKLTAAAGRISRSPIQIDDTHGLSIMELRARARCMYHQFGIKLFVVDYLQLLHSTSRRAQDNRQIEITEISGGIKALAKELKVPVIALSQLNRDLEKQKRIPGLADLRESGAIEQDADVVGLLYKPGSKDDDDGPEEPDGIPANLYIAKQRNGPTGTVNLTFLKPYTRFESAAKVSDDDVPQDSGYKSTTKDP